jgi:hypothetical protein
MTALSINKKKKERSVFSNEERTDTRRRRPHYNHRHIRGSKSKSTTATHRMSEIESQKDAEK